MKEECDRIKASCMCGVLHGLASCMLIRCDFPVVPLCSFFIAAQLSKSQDSLTELSLFLWKICEVVERTNIAPLSGLSGVWTRLPIVRSVVRQKAHMHPPHCMMPDRKMFPSVSRDQNVGNMYWCQEGLDVYQVLSCRCH